VHRNKPGIAVMVAFIFHYGSRLEYQHQPLAYQILKNREAECKRLQPPHFFIRIIDLISAHIFEVALN
jgi:hypothetical protein